MEVVRIREKMKKDGEILLTGLPYKKGQHIEMIVMPEFESNSDQSSTAKQLLASGLVGMWKGKAIDDSSAYAHNLREKAQRRNNR